VNYKGPKDPRAGKATFFFFSSDDRKGGGVFGGWGGEEIHGFLD